MLPILQPIAFEITRPPMKLMNKLICFSLLALLFSQCECDDEIGKETLPPATQTGANTFGCLVNGKIWLPRGDDGTYTLDLSYDPTFNDGTFDLRAKRYVSDSQLQYIIIFSDSLSAIGDFPIKEKTHQVVTFSDGDSCYYSTDEQETFCTGTLSITRFDLANGIISGEFNFSIVTSGCTKIEVSKGRFDMRI